MTNQKRNLKGKALEEYKKTLVLNDVQKDIIIGTLLGDSTMGLRSGKPFYGLKFEQSAIREKYITHLYQEFESFCGSPPQKRWIDTKKTRQSVWCRTYRHDCFIYYFDMFYEIHPDLKKGKLVSKKIVPLDIAQFLNPRVLAYWFMDDGTLNRQRTPRSGIAPLPSLFLSTQGFEKHECELLCKALYSSLNIKSNVHKDDDQWRIYILQESAPLFRELVTSYVVDDFRYKLS